MFNSLIECLHVPTGEQNYGKCPKCAWLPFNANPLSNSEADGLKFLACLRLLNAHTCVTAITDPFFASLWKAQHCLFTTLETMLLCLLILQKRISYQTREWLCHPSGQTERRCSTAQACEWCAQCQLLIIARGTHIPNTYSYPLTAPENKGKMPSKSLVRLNENLNWIDLCVLQSGARGGVPVAQRWWICIQTGCKPVSQKSEFLCPPETPSPKTTRLCPTLALAASHPRHFAKSLKYLE